MPTAGVLYVWVQAPASPVARVPAVIVGLTAEVADPSYTLVAAVAVTVIGRVATANVRVTSGAAA